jgi:CBS domain containing-hemolysin-like protein
MTLTDAPGMPSAFVLLGVATLAAIQARAVRGAQRQVIQELCIRRRRPERYEEIIGAAETIAFIAATVVVVAAVAATLLAFTHEQVAEPEPLAGELAAVGGWILLAWLLLVVVPMLLVRFAGPWIVVATWQVWRPIVRLGGPVVAQLGRFAVMLPQAFGRTSGPDTERSQDELRLVVDEAHREGRLEDQARDMIRGVIGLDEVRVARVMTPRTSIVSIAVATPWEEAVRIAAESGHTRLPVWSGSPDEVVGILHIRDVLGMLAEGFAADAPPPALRPLLRPPWFVPESMSVQTLLREFQRGNTHMAVVTDEFGGVSGLVTIEDALEEIVGEIADEHDEAFADGIRMLSDHAGEVLAHVRIAEVNRRFGVALPEERDYDTLGGFVFHECGRIPEIGERLETHGARLEVLAATRRRIDLVRVERLAAAAPLEEPAHDGR